jgi:hypothetical protein
MYNTAMNHTPDWHLLDNSFPDANAGIPIPLRTTSAGPATLQITNLDRADPPGYTAGGVPRGAAFNRNVFRLGPDPCMPAIPVTCNVSGFNPSSTPIQWRLISRHVLCRHMNTGGYRYKGSSEILQREWRGESRAASFTIFGPDAPECRCTYNDQSRVLGGHAILMVAAQAPSATLLDYVHLRIGGSNPSVENVYSYLDKQLAGYDPNVVSMLRAIYAHESGFQQFAARPQTQTAMTFKKGYHTDPAQPDCRVIFDWPDDPENFPLASFDFGLGISQFTKVGQQKVTEEIAWDWRENIRMSANLFLGKLKRKSQPGLTWQHWAMDAWAAYNGSGAAADLYAKQLSMSPEGSKIPLTPVSGITEIALISPPAALTAPANWVVA